jgi:uncharacterized protein
MHTVSGEAMTAEAPRIIKRLCNHWGHKLTVRMDGSDGVIEFPDAEVALRALPDRISATISSKEPAAVARLPAVVATHLQRMAGPEAQLQVSWSPPG